MDNQPLTQEQAEEFVRLWQRMPGSRVASVFKMSRQRAHQIADVLIKAGVPLRKKQIPYALSVILDIAKLKEIALSEMEKR